MVEYNYICPICGNCFTFPVKYTIFKLVCEDCERKAVDESGNEPYHDSWKDEGSNPLYIDGIKCWCRYKFGGFVSMTYESWEQFLNESRR